MGQSRLRKICPDEWGEGDGAVPLQQLIDEFVKSQEEYSTIFYDDTMD
jgi:hypothetical protein